MGSDWTKMPFTEAVSINPTVCLKKGKEYPFVDMKAVDPSWREASHSEFRIFKSGGAKFLPNDTLMARITPCLENGKIARYIPVDGSNSPAFGSTEFIVIRGKDGVTDNSFAYYLTKWQEFRQFAISQMTGSSGRQRVPVDSLGGFYIPVPEISEQRTIAHVLGSLDDKIELNRRMNKTLESMAQALFKSWFIDFDPVIDNALASGNAIPEELQSRAALRESLGDARKPLPEDVRTLFPSEFERADNIGWIPKGWRAKTVGDEVAVIGGGTPSTKQPDYWENGIHAFCTPKDMSNLSSRILIKTERYLTDKGMAKVSSGQLPVGTVLMSSRAPIGYLAITDVPVTINQGIIAMVGQDEFRGVFLFCWAKANIENVMARANGSTFLEISKKNFRPIPFIVPNNEIVKAFNKNVDPLYVRLISCTRNMEELSMVRDTLLPKLLSGEIRIPEAEQKMESVL